MNLIAGRPEDLDELFDLEMACFEPARRASRRALRHSLTSRRQRVYLLKEEERLCGALILMYYKRLLRIYSVAVAPDCRNKGYGDQMLQFAMEEAVRHGMGSVSLEVDCHQGILVKWYEDQGFEVRSVLENYYGPRQDAYRMVCSLHKAGGPRNVVIADFDTDFFDGMEQVEVIRAQTYIEDPVYQQARQIRLFNLCERTDYQSIGYYVSLLARARNQIIYPSLATMRDAENRMVLRSIGQEIHDAMQSALKDVREDTLTVRCYFGHAENPAFQPLVKWLNRLYEAPLVAYTFARTQRWELEEMRLIPLRDVPETEQVRIWAGDYFRQNRFGKGVLSNFQYDLAILVDEEETSPPSDTQALRRFKSAAETIGFYVEFITQKDYHRIPEFDALFIRTTTAVNHYTYDFARYAYAEGLAVIDDPWSIMGCSNKLYLFERLGQAGIPMPSTWLFNLKGDWEKRLEEMQFPLILKQPDSAFSKGVHKVTDKEACREKLEQLFTTSELVIGQAFTPSDFDWRIGVLDQRPLFACRYFMAKGHWQIFNWEETDTDLAEGGTETVPIDQVPEKVIRTALRAANLMGNGLYGVDLKQIGERVVVIEVNDNPNIDAGVEDLCEGDALYRRVMQVFYDRIESERQSVRPISR